MTKNPATLELTISGFPPGVLANTVEVAIHDALKVAQTDEYSSVVERHSGKVTVSYLVKRRFAKRFVADGGVVGQEFMDGVVQSLVDLLGDLPSLTIGVGGTNPRRQSFDPDAAPF